MAKTMNPETVGISKGKNKSEMATVAKVASGPVDTGGHGGRKTKKS